MLQYHTAETMIFLINLKSKSDKFVDVLREWAKIVKFSLRSKCPQRHFVIPFVSFGKNKITHWYQYNHLFLYHM